MICPECEKGMVVGLAYKIQEDPYRETSVLTHPEKYFHKVPCRRCNGSGIAYWCDGEDAGRPNRRVGDNAVVKEAQAVLN